MLTAIVEHVNQRSVMLLAIETSTGPASIALSNGEEIIDMAANRQSERLIPAIDALVSNHTHYHALQAIVVSVGPGGFTGIRVGLAAARGIGLAADLPVIAVTSLEAYGWQILAENPVGSKVLCLIDAYRQQSYAQAFERCAQGLMPLCECLAIENGALADFAAQWPDALCIGNLKEFSYPHYISQPAPLARYALSYVQELLQYHSMQHLAKTRPAEAHYIRPPDAKPQTPLSFNPKNSVK